MKYELSHDILAKLIFEKTSLETKQRRRTELFIKRHHEDYQETRTLLTKSELQYIRPYLKDLSISSEQRQFVRKSQRNHVRRRFIFTIIVVLILLGIGFTYIAYLQQKKETFRAGLISVIFGDLEKGEFTDPRDNQVYKTVLIGTTMWMAENLNYEMEGSWCYNNNPRYCKKYGRLYTWEAANRACPEGWRLTRYEEWKELEEYNLPETIGIAEFLKKGGGTGLDLVPGGYRLIDKQFSDLGASGYYWSSGDYKDEAWYFYFDIDLSPLYFNYMSKSTAQSCRCIRK